MTTLAYQWCHMGGGSDYTLQGVTPDWN